MNKQIFVVKASGEKSEFSEKKLRNSLQRASANENEVNTIIEQVHNKLHDGMTTKSIYKIAFNLLKESSNHLAAKYHLKGAIMELGPSGYPFEKYVGEILRHQGYKIRIGEIVQGKCVSHEIDVIAELDQKHFMIECKYHNLPGIFCDVKIPLYIQSRFKDVEAEWLKLPDHERRSHQGWVVTNTRFSTDAIKYGNCIGLKLLGWDYPLKDGLKDIIDRLGLYPITCLTTLTKKEKQFLLDKKIVLCNEIKDNENYLISAGVNQTRIKSITKEVNQLCEHLIQNTKI